MSKEEPLHRLKAPPGALGLDGQQALEPAARAAQEDAQQRRVPMQVQKTTPMASNGRDGD